MTPRLNTNYILFHLREAAEAAQQTVAEIERQSDYDIGSYIVDMMHLYHHVNTAWNARFATPEQAKACTEDDYERWSQFPSDLQPL